MKTASLALINRHATPGDAPSVRTTAQASIGNDLPVTRTRQAPSGPSRLGTVFSSFCW